MAGNDQQVFIDDDLIERLLRGEGSPNPAPPKSAETPASLAKAADKPASSTTVNTEAPPVLKTAAELPEPTEASTQLEGQTASQTHTLAEIPVPEIPAETLRGQEETVPLVPGILTEHAERVTEHVTEHVAEATRLPSELAERPAAEAASSGPVSPTKEQQSEPAETVVDTSTTSAAPLGGRRKEDRIGAGENAPVAKKRSAFSGSFAIAVSLASQGRLDEAIEELEGTETGENAVEVHSGLGHLRFEQQNWAEAARHYGEVVKDEPEHPTAHYNLALCLEHLGKYEEAAAQFATALKVDPNRWLAALGRGLCLVRIKQSEEGLRCLFIAETENLKSTATNPQTTRDLQDRILFGKAVALQQMGQMAEAGEIYDGLRRAHPGATDLLANSMAVAAARKDWVQVEETSAKLAEIDAQSRPALHGLAAAALGHGDYQTAIRRGEQLVGSLPETGEEDQFSLWFNLGVAYTQAGRIEDAGRAYQEACRLRPESLEVNTNLAAVLHETGDLKAARAAYLRALAMRPGLEGDALTGVEWNLALIAEREGNAREAERLFGKVVAIRPNWEDAAFRLGVLQLERGDYAAARASFEVCLKQHGEWSDAEINLGTALWKLGELGQAAATLRRVLDREPGNQDALRALTAVALEQHDGAAVELYRKLQAQGPPPAELSYNVGLLLQETGDFAASRGCYAAAIDEKPEFAQAWLNLGHALLAEGDEEGARKIWSRAVAHEPALAEGYF